jgi:mRNA interferase RelE/StbE
MESYTISLASSVGSDLKKVDRQAVPRIIAAIDALAEEPRPTGCRKLAGSLHTYRIRIGDYRVIYSVDDGSRDIVIERVRHRKDAYR